MHFFLKVILSEVNDFTGFLLIRIYLSFFDKKLSFLLINIFLIYKSSQLNLTFSSCLAIFVARGFCLPYLCLFCVWISGYHIQIDRGFPTAPQLFTRFVPYLQKVCSHTLDMLWVQFSPAPQSLWPRGLQNARLPCPSPTPRVFSNSCPLTQWCHPTISSSVILFSCCLQSFPASGSFPMSQFFPSGGQSIGVSASASVLPKNIQD